MVSVCDRHTGVIGADFGSCAPLHWNFCGVSHYAEARAHERVARLNGLYRELSAARRYGTTRDERSAERDIRILREEMNHD